MSNLLGSKTEWEKWNIKKPPPSNIYLLIKAKIAATEFPIITIGYWSDRANTLMCADDGYALLESLDVVGYHAVTDEDGNYINCVSEIPVEL